MIQRIRRFFKKDYLITQLMYFYGMLLVGIILFGVLALSVYTNYNNQKNLSNQIGLLENRLDTFINNKNTTLSYMYMELAGTHAEAENVNRYIELSPSDYFQYTDAYWQQTKTDNRVSTTLTGFFNAFTDLEEIYITLDNSDHYIKADRHNQNGYKMTGILDQPEGLTIKRPIINQHDFQPMGMIYAVFSKDALMSNLSDSLKDMGISTVVYDQSGTILFIESNQLADSDKELIMNGIDSFQPINKSLLKYFMVVEKKANNGVSYIILSSRKCLLFKNLREMGLILLVGAVLAGALLITLRRTFRRYLKQITALVQITYSVGEGNLNERVDVSAVQDELYDLATAINFMIESLDQFIKENYELELKQRDAHLRALQAQINPHFLYNTLEYIRMYATSLYQEELADVVFALSVLLRNNITHEKVISLDKELSFCEKYVYLYQMRYPDQIAYHFKIDPQLKELNIPKFSIQPLIENYFVHGIDYTRQDNVISVEAFKDEEQCIIRIRDNGKGINQQRLEEIRCHLHESESNTLGSIGLKNVHERMKSFFREAYKIQVISTEYAGTEIRMTIEQEEGPHV